MSADLELALRMADAADAISLARFRAHDLRVETKPDMTPVTEADRAVERLLREMLAEGRPDDAIVGEEEGSTGESDRRWILDPIDGTKNYSRGIPIFATQIALEADGDVVLGVVSAPALARRWWAERGGGAFLNGEPIRVSRIDRVEDATVSGDIPTDALVALERRSWHGRHFGDFWQHMLVAEGAADVAIDPVCYLWDVAPMLPILEEAGGRLTTVAGERDPGGGSAVSTNGRLHDAVLASLG